MSEKKQIENEELKQINGGANVVGSIPYINTFNSKSVAIDGDNVVDNNNKKEKTGE